MKHASALALCLLLFLCGSVVAQAPAPTQRIRGDVVALNGLSLQVKSRSGEMLAIKLADNYVVTAVVKIDMTAIKPGAFVGTATMPQPDGSLTATRVAVGKDGLVPPM